MFFPLSRLVRISAPYALRCSLQKARGKAGVQGVFLSLWHGPLRHTPFNPASSLKKKQGDVNPPSKSFKKTREGDPSLCAGLGSGVRMNRGMTSRGTVSIWAMGPFPACPLRFIAFFKSV
ncbi:hypothetical protein SCFA_950022 [anaerobic digester metagenome]|uniref:Uncharacterized protein n=1 Tax=anaerobic digester metagenome TaxID=1263854 RepID=A0A485M7M2_9ZZZZ